MYLYIIKNKDVTVIKLQHSLNIIIMAKSQDAKKNTKKAPLKTAKEKKAEKRAKKANQD